MVELSAIDAAVAAARQSIRRHNRFVSFLTLIIIPLLLGIWIEKADTAVTSLVFWTVIIGLFLFQLTTFLFLEGRVEEQVPGLLFAFNQQQEDLKEITSYTDELTLAIGNTSAAQVIGAAWSSAQAHVPRYLREGISLNHIYSGIIDPLIEQANAIFDWGYDDKWTISVYQWDDAAELLTPVWWRRAERHPSSNVPRTWRNGEGHCGTAYMSQEMLFTNDLHEQSTANRVRPTPANVRPYDHDAYRSFATVPLTIEGVQPGSEVRLGVLTMTSDVPGRFTEGNVGVAQQLGDVLAGVMFLGGIAETSGAANVVGEAE